MFGTQIYVFAGMLPPFAIESEETRASARHCTVGIEPRISNERIILLDTQVSFQLIVFLLYGHISMQSIAIYVTRLLMNKDKLK